MEEQLTMAPLPWVRICRSSCFMQVQIPRRLIAITRSKLSRRLIGGVADETEDAGIVERHVQPTERLDRTLDHGRDLCLVRHVTGDPDRLVTGRSELLGRDAERALVDVGQDDGRARLGVATAPQRARCRSWPP